jgi:putative FmdB family regulatory protein
MPLFEYICRDCQHRFEVLVTVDRVPGCPACRSRSLEKQVSVFAVSTGARARPAPATACGTCGDPRGPGACNLDNE